MENKKVIVIDDEDFIRELVKDFLEMEEIHCDGAENADLALALLKKNKYDLILLDRNLGRNKAEDVVVKIRELTLKTPIVLLTGDADCDEAYQKKVGVDAIVFKPFQVVEFMDQISKFLAIE